MKSKNTQREIFNQALARLSAAPMDDMESAHGRVGDILKSGPVASAETDGLLNAEPASLWSLRKPWLLAVAAVLLLAAVSETIFRSGIPEADAHALAESVDGTLDRISAGGESLAVRTGDRIKSREIIRAGGNAGSVLALADGSRVEMRTQSELSLEPAADGVRIRLNRGAVIVTAAPQAIGRLYVQTKDLTASVISTVFFVGAEETGSRVAVIQGLVVVEQGSTVKHLIRGEQIATDPQTEPLPLSDEISWSRNAEAHQVLLQQPATVELKRCGPDDLRSIVHNNGGWNLRLIGTLWRNYRCQRSLAGE